MKTTIVTVQKDDDNDDEDFNDDAAASDAISPKWCKVHQNRKQYFYVFYDIVLLPDEA